MTPDNNQDIYASVLVANIDIGCSDQSVDIVKVSNRVLDAEGNVSTEIFDKHDEWSHSDFFQVKFDGKPYRVAPGKTAILPRFVAEHFAKHLADHLLQKKEDETKRRGLVTSPIERPKVLKQIISELDSGEFTVPTPTEVVSEPVVDNTPTENAGIVPNTAEGVLIPEPPTLAEILKVAGEDPDKVDRIPISETSITDEKKPTPTRKQLIELCYGQSIDITGMENKAELIEKLKRG